MVLTRPYYGVLLAPTLVLAAYGATHVSPDHLYRPLAALTLGAAAVFLLVGIISRRWHLAAFLTALLLLAVVGAFQLYCLLAAVGLVFAWRSVRRGAGVENPGLTRPLNVVVMLWLAIATATAIVVSWPNAARPSTADIEVEPGRNLYLILLDGYPRHDSLEEYFGFDNRPFLQALEARGFVVSEQSTTDYESTILVVPSMLNVTSVDDLLGAEWVSSEAQHRRLWEELNQAAVPAAYREAGYSAYSIVSPAAGLDWRNADIVLESPWLTAFEQHLLERGVIRPLLPKRAMHRATILDAFDNLEASAGRSPRFVLAHILSPHDPYVFAADGGPAAPCPSQCVNHAGPPNPVLGDRLIGQVTFVNSRLLEALDHIVEVDPAGIIIVFSDHGLRRDPSDREEWYRTLFAARNHSFADDVTLGEVFHALTGVGSR